VKRTSQLQRARTQCIAIRLTVLAHITTVYQSSQEAMHRTRMERNPLAQVKDANPVRCGGKRFEDIK